MVIVNLYWYRSKSEAVIAQESQEIARNRTNQSRVRDISHEHVGDTLVAV